MPFDLTARSFAILGVAAVAVLAPALPAGAQAGVWTSRGPLGGNVYCLAADPSHPSTLYAGTSLGVFRTEDGGASWARPAGGVPAGRVQTIAIDPTAPGVLYAGTVTPNGVPSLGVYKSTDGGASWATINDGLSDPFTGIAPLDVAALAIDPYAPSTLIAGTRFSELFKTTDGGGSWYPVTAGGYSAGLQVTAIQYDPSNSKNVYAASTLGLLKSTDGGESWAVFGNAGVSFFTLTLDPSSPATLYAGNQTGSGIYKSTDGGSHWTAIHNGLPPPSGSSGSFALVDSLALDPSSPSTVYAATYGNGLYVSRDAGATWSAASGGIRNTAILSVAPAANGAAVYAGTLGDGVFRSADHAQSWTPANAGFKAASVYTLLADDSTPDTVYAGTSDGIRKTSDGGASWQLSVNGVSSVPVVCLTRSPGGSPTLYAGTLGAGLRRSADGGASWAAPGGGLNDSYVSSIALDPSAPSTMYAGTAHPYDGSSSERLYKSSDGGSTWTQTSLDAGGFSVDFIAVNPGRPAEVFVGSIGAAGLFHTVNGGQAWSALATDVRCGGVNGLLFDSSGANLLLAGTRGVCRSGDGGQTWTVATVGSGLSVRAILRDPAGGSVLYAGTAANPDNGDGGVFRSSDGGQTWSSLGNPAPGATVTSLALTGAMLHAGTFGAGVFDLSPPAGRAGVALRAGTHGPPRAVPNR